MHVTRKHGRWYVVVSIDGAKRWRQIVDERGVAYEGKGKADARRLARAVEARVLAAVPRRRQGTGGSLREVVPDFLAAKNRDGKAERTLHMIAHHLSYVVAILGEQTHVGDVDYSTVERYLSSRQMGLPLVDLGDGKTERRARPGPVTLRKELSSIRQLVAYAVARGFRRHSAPMPKVGSRKEDRRKKWTVLSPEQAPVLTGDLRQHARTRAWAWIQFAMNTGLRRGEIWKASWDWIRFDAPARVVVPAWAAKDGEERVVPLSDGALEALRAVMPSPEPTGPIWGRYTPSEALRRGCERSGLPRMRIHDLRHTAASLWLGAGATVAEVRDLLGHCDLSMVSLYAHSVEDGRVSAVQRASVGGTPPGRSVVALRRTGTDDAASASDGAADEDDPASRVRQPVRQAGEGGAERSGILGRRSGGTGRRAGLKIRWAKSL